jgi:hypothetical protein
MSNLGKVRVTDYAGHDRYVDPFVKIEDIGKQPDAIELAAQALEWTAVMEALVVIHGKHRAAKRLAEMGCPIRFHGEDTVIVRGRRGRHAR